MLKKSLVLFISLVLLGCGSSKDEPDLPTLPVVRLLQLDPEAIIAERYFPARLEASQAANLSFQVPGRLVHIPVIKGDKIAKGALIARLEQTDYRLLLESARVGYEKAERDLKRLQQLHQQNHVSQAQLDEARTAYDRANVEKERAAQNLIYTEIFAPYDAIIADRMVENFTQVSAGTPVVRIQDLSRLEVEIAVPEILLPEVEDPNGYTVTATLPSLPERPFDLSFKEYSTEPNPRSRTYRVTFEMENPGDLRLLPGMSATVKVALKPKELRRPVLPLQALVGQGEQTHVFVYAPETGTVSLRQVELGRLLAEGIEIVSGIHQGEWVVAAGAGFLSEGMQVRSDRELKESR
ncbi:efflux RND transporter periplasmic adaptor subunit [Nitrincola nitratireducens]|uniref:Multidrug resistance protein mexA n=1 Tax=Nitrincola nitratireducens TaxID=1229521 RepID=W9UY30_9GAMM|nr:efflux RND transporter periplasmic adaptor subunit [Nitrincola nitratireducens]EXJ11974.1 Multidrug resistance protein mexA precursor [Nitrincola nitratireducens]